VECPDGQVAEGAGREAFLDEMDAACRNGRMSGSGQIIDATALASLQR
jgi:hypothetical protein